MAAGLGDAFEEAAAQGGHHDVFFLIPGDFDFSKEEGKVALQRLRRIPQRILDDECEICLGEIQVPVNSAKQLIDTYGTYGLLYNGFLLKPRAFANAQTSRARSFLRSIMRP